ncbi:Immunity-related GTPase family Q protein [Camelus dromedarius]|uniref:Immunity-related GTPase family Q protein n=1 Tax=Camelus dromedarius TaxID=9838 RepID=A0A5N4DTS3_CAMDR|nr:Immunity-related GTPase family Q protein [Camelus dromedarius]
MKLRPGIRSGPAGQRRVGSRGSLFVVPTDCRSSDGCEELERLRRRCGARRGAAEVTRPPATRSDGFEVLGAAELEAVREARDRGLEAALRGFAPPGRTGQRRLDLAVAGKRGLRARGRLSPEDEYVEVLEEAPAALFPLRPGGLPGLCEWLRRALPPAQEGAAAWRCHPRLPAQPEPRLRRCGPGRGGRHCWRAWRGGSSSTRAGLGVRRGAPARQLAEWRRALGLEPAALARRERALGLAPGVLAERTRFPGSVTRAEVEASLGSWAGDGTDRGAALGRSPSCARVAAGGHRGWLPPSHGVLLQALDEMRADAEAVLAPQVPAQ